MNLSLKHKLILAYGAVILAVLIVPLIAMQFTQEVNWSISDFIVAFFLLGFFYIGIELIIRVMKNKKVKFVLIPSAIIIVILLWMELAIGIFGTPIVGN